MQNDLVPSARSKPDTLSLELYERLINKLRGQGSESLQVTESVCLNKSVDSTNIQSVGSVQKPKTRKRHSSGEVMRAKPDVSVIKLSQNNVVGKFVMPTESRNDLKIVECDSATNNEQEYVSDILSACTETKHASLFSRNKDDNDYITNEFVSKAYGSINNKSRNGISSLINTKSKYLKEDGCEQYCTEPPHQTVVQIETGKDNNCGEDALKSKMIPVKCSRNGKQINESRYINIIESEICLERENRKPSNSKKRGNLQQNVQKNHITSKRIKLSPVVNKANVHTESKKLEHACVAPKTINVKTKEHTYTNGRIIRKTGNPKKPTPQDDSGFMLIDDHSTWNDGISSSKDRNSANHTVDVESIMPLNTDTEMHHSRKAKLAIDKEKGLLNRRYASSGIWESLNAHYQ